MDSAKIFALGLAAGLAIHVLVRKTHKDGRKADGQQSTQSSTIPSTPVSSSSASKSKNKKKKSSAAAAKDVAASALAEVKKVVEEPKVEDKEPEPAPATSSKKNKKKAKAAATASPSSQPAAAAAPADESYAEVASEPPAINNETVRARADAAQTAFTASLGDMRDHEVDPLPAGYSSVLRIPAPEQVAEKPKLSKKDVDDGWSSVGGTFPSSSSASKSNGANGAPKANGTGASKGGYAAIASNNPFAALPDDATTTNVRRIPASKPSTVASAKANGWTVAGHGPVKASSYTNNSSNGVSAETKKQRSNANKAQAKKAAKEEADRLQAERLANHRRQQANEQAKQREQASRPAPRSVPGSAKTPSAKASVDLNGRLVWD